MSNTPHTLAEEFPGQGEAISKLKASNSDFAKLLILYDEINDRIHLAETNLNPVDQLAETEMRKERLRIKDEIGVALGKS